MSRARLFVDDAVVCRVTDAPSISSPARQRDGTDRLRSFGGRDGLSAGAAKANTTKVKMDPR